MSHVSIPGIISYATNQPHNSLQLWGSWEEHLKALCEGVRCKAGAGEVVKRLKDSGIEMAVATSSLREAMEVKMAAQPDLFGRFAHSCIVTGDDPAVVRGKPNPDIFLEAARRIGLAPSECLAFEDSLSGVKAAADAGMHVIAIPDPRQVRRSEVRSDVNHPIFVLGKYFLTLLCLRP